MDDAMVSPKIACVAASLLLSLGGIAAAHHSGAAYDMEHPRDMEGTVKTVVEADAKDGQPAQSFAFEVSSPGVLTRSGWTKRSLQPGDHAVFHYAPLRDGNPGGFLLRVNLQSGQELSFSLQPSDE
jgi:hypothetical protein